MKKSLIALTVALILLIPSFTYARGGHSSSGSSYKSYKSSSYKTTISKKSSYKAYTAPKVKKASSTAYKAPKAKKVKATTYTATATSTKKHKSTYCATCPRDKNGKIKRSEAAKKAFEKQSGYPHGRPGYVVDHIKPLKEGGADDPSNMQWQTVEEAKAKDKIE